MISGLRSRSWRNARAGWDDDLGYDLNLPRPEDVEVWTRPTRGHWHKSCVTLACKGKTH